jgi:hypothetical protein
MTPHDYRDFDRLPSSYERWLAQRVGRQRRRDRACMLAVVVCAVVIALAVGAQP